MFFRTCLFSPRNAEKIALSAPIELIHDFLPNLRVKVSAGFSPEGSEISLTHARFFFEPSSKQTSVVLKLLSLQKYESHLSCKGGVFAIVMFGPFRHPRTVFA